MEPSSRLELRSPGSASTTTTGALICLFAVAIGALGACKDQSVLVVLVAIGFAVWGVKVAADRHGVIVDRKARTIETWRGLWLPMKRTSHPWGAFSHVAISQEIHGSGRSESIEFPIQLCSPEVDIRVLSTRNYDTSRRFAERLANYLSVGLEDTSSGAPVIKQAGTLNQPVGIRLRREESIPETPAAITPQRLAVRREGDTTICHMPTSGSGAFIVALGMLGAMIVRFVTIPTTDPEGRVITAGVVIPLAGVVLLLAAPAFLRRRVTFSREEITVSALGRPGKTKRIPADKLKELVLQDGPMGRSIVARSETTTLAIGKGLSGEELTWLHASICHALVSGPFGYRDLP